MNDILWGGAKVYSVVKLDASDLPGVYEYTLENSTKIKTSKNVFIRQKDASIINTVDLVGIEIKKPKYLYHILTDTGAFIMNDFYICDYNYCVDTYLGN